MDVPRGRLLLWVHSASELEQLSATLDQLQRVLDNSEEHRRNITAKQTILQQELSSRTAYLESMKPLKAKGYVSLSQILNQQSQIDQTRSQIHTNNNDLINELKKIIDENNIKGIVIGYPINMDGTLGPSAQSVSDVSKNIDKNIDVDVCLWDERLSTVGAFNLSSQLDINVSKREKNIDQNAAAFILQGAIDYLNN